MTSRLGVRAMGLRPAAPTASQRNWSAMIMTMLGRFLSPGALAGLAEDCARTAGSGAAAAERLRNSRLVTDDFSGAGFFRSFTRTSSADGKRSPATALLVFLSAAARAGVVPARLPSRRCAGIALPHPLHDVRRRPALAKLRRHELHVGIDVVKKQLVARAKVVQSLFAIRRASEPVL